jgi:hypothetical protein
MPAALYSQGMVIVSIRGLVNPRAIVRLEGLGKLKKSDDLIGNRNRGLLASNIVLQPREPTVNLQYEFYSEEYCTLGCDCF